MTRIEISYAPRKINIAGNHIETRVLKLASVLPRGHGLELLQIHGLDESEASSVLQAMEDHKSGCLREYATTPEVMEAIQR